VPYVPSPPVQPELTRWFRSGHDELDRPAVPDDDLLVPVLASSANPVDLFALSLVGDRKAL
jgi:NADPH:quinone reductase-like Zn-dependent oxidoreductase